MERKAREKSFCRHPLAAFALEFENSQRADAAADDDAAFVGG